MLVWAVALLSAGLAASCDDERKPKICAPSQQERHGASRMHPVVRTEAAEWGKSQGRQRYAIPKGWVLSAHGGTAMEKGGLSPKNLISLHNENGCTWTGGCREQACF